MNNPIWEKEIEVPPSEEQIGQIRKHVDEDGKTFTTLVNKELIVNGSSCAPTTFLGKELAWELDNLSPGEYIIQVVEV